VRWDRPWTPADDGYKRLLGLSHDQLWQQYSATIRRYFPTPGAWKPEYENYVRILYAPSLTADWPRLAMVRTLLQQVVFFDPVVDDWAHIKAPTLVLGGDKDGENFPALAKHIADTVPHGQLDLLPNLGHVPHIESPEVFNRELLKFIK